MILLMNQLFGRYNCNRYDEEEAKKARDAQEVNIAIYFSYTVEQGKGFVI